MEKDELEIVNSILSIIINESNPDKVILFGSHARGDQNLKVIMILLF